MVFLIDIKLNVFGEKLTGPVMGGQGTSPPQFLHTFLLVWAWEVKVHNLGWEERQLVQAPWRDQEEN